VRTIFLILNQCSQLIKYVSHALCVNAINLVKKGEGGVVTNGPSRGLMGNIIIFIGNIYYIELTPNI